MLFAWWTFAWLLFSPSIEDDEPTIRLEKWRRGKRCWRIDNRRPAIFIASSLSVPTDVIVAAISELLEWWLQLLQNEFPFVLLSLWRDVCSSFGSTKRRKCRVFNLLSSKPNKLFSSDFTFDLIESLALSFKIMPDLILESFSYSLLLPLWLVFIATCVHADAFSRDEFFESSAATTVLFFESSIATWISLNADTPKVVPMWSILCTVDKALHLSELMLNRALNSSVLDLDIKCLFDAAIIRNRTKSMSLSGSEGSEDESDWSDGVAFSRGVKFKVAGAIRVLVSGEFSLLAFVVEVRALRRLLLSLGTWFEIFNSSIQFLVTFGFPINSMPLFSVWRSCGVRRCNNWAFFSFCSLYDCALWWVFCTLLCGLVEFATFVPLAWTSLNITLNGSHDVLISWDLVGFPELGCSADASWGVGISKPNVRSRGEKSKSFEASKSFRDTESGSAEMLCGALLVSISAKENKLSCAIFASWSCPNWTSEMLICTFDSLLAMVAFVPTFGVEMSIMSESLYCTGPIRAFLIGFVTRL